MGPQPEDRVVWKYTRPVPVGAATLELPKGAQLLHVGDQGGTGQELTFWFLVNPDSTEDELLHYLVLGTGREAPAQALGSHLGTVVTAGGALVWHVFEESGAA